MSDIPPLRVLRAMVLGLIGRKPLTETQQRREAEILNIATTAIALYGRNKIRLKPLAQALRICVDTLRWHFADIDEILGEIILRHLKTLQEAIAEIPPKAEDRAARVQQALKAHALTKSGALTEAHILLLRERHVLPADVLGPIAETWAKLRTTLQAALPEKARYLLQDLPPLREASTCSAAPAASPASAPGPDPGPDPGPAAATNTTRTAGQTAGARYPTGEARAALAADRQPATLQPYLATHTPEQTSAGDTRR